MPSHQERVRRNYDADVVEASERDESNEIRQEPPDEMSGRVDPNALRNVTTEDDAAQPSRTS